MKKTLLQIIAVTVITFSLSWAADRLMNLWLLRIAFPETMALEDFHWEDFVFKLRPDLPMEKRIVMVNIGQARRREIGKMIEIINEHKPKVVGVLVFFNCLDGLRDSVNCPQLLDVEGNRSLSSAIRKTKEIVLATALRSSSSSMKNNLDKIDSIEYSDYQFSHYSHNAFASLPQANYQDIKESRSFFPQYIVGNKVENSFSIQVCLLYDSTKTMLFLQRRNNEEIINFRGNVGNYQYNLGSTVLNKEKYFETVEYDSLMLGNYAKGLFENKIVLIGYLGDYLNDPTYLDKFYTPLNATFAGRSYPDMLALVVHANIISMVLNEDYINQLSDFWEHFILILIVTLNAILFIALYRRNSIWYDSLCFIIPVVQIVFISWLRIELMTDYAFRLDLQNVLYLIAFVSFATNLYFGPLLSFRNKILSRQKP